MADNNKDQFNEEFNRQNEISKCCNGIENICSNFVIKLAPYDGKLKESVGLQYILFYSQLLLNYGKDIAVLRKNNRNQSIAPLTRIFLECYACVKKLMELYDNPQEFNKYFQYLVFMDMNQDLFIYENLISDEDITDTARLNADMETYTIRFETLIKEYFPDKAQEIGQSSKMEDIKTIIHSLYRYYKHNIPDEIQNKYKMVNNAIKRNRFIGKEYDDTMFLYGALSHFIHNNLSAIDEILVQDGNLVPDADYENILPYIQITYNCLKDTLLEFEEILKTE